MSETNTESATVDSSALLSEQSSIPIVVPSISSSSSPSNTVDDETKRRKILSKLWGKGNKSSHKVRELEKTTNNNSSDTPNHREHDQQQSVDNLNEFSSYSSSNDPKSITDDNSNSINNSKPLAVVKPIVVVKAGLIVSPANDRTRVNSEASSITITQADDSTSIIAVTERQPSSTTTTDDRTSSKKKKSHKKEDSKKKKTTREKSNERERSKDRRHHHHRDESSSKKTRSSSSSSKNYRQDHNEDTSPNNNNKNHHQKSSRHHSSSTTSVSKNRRRSPSNDIEHSTRRASQSITTTSKRDEPSSSSKRSTVSSTDHHHRHSNSKYETPSSSSSHRHHRGSSRTPSPTSSRSRHSTTKRDRSPRKHSLSPRKDDRNSTTTTTKSTRQQPESVSNSKSTNSHSPSDSSSNYRRHDTDIIPDNDTHRHKTRTSDENATNFLKSEKSHEISPDHRSSTTSTKQEKSKSSNINNDENLSERRKVSSSRHDRRSHSRHRSRSKEDKTNRKTIDSSTSEESSINKNKTNHEKDSTTIHENSNNKKNKKFSRDSSIPSTRDGHRRKSSPDHHHYHHQYDRHHHSPSHYDRKHDYYYDDHHSHSRHSYSSKTHYVHHHHHHHYRSPSPRYHHHHHRRSISPRSHHDRSRYYSSSSSSLTPSPRRRTPSSRTSSSSSRSSSSYSSISRTSSSRSSPRNNYYHHQHHHEKKYRRSPTLEKLFLKASESIESISTQKNPNLPPSSLHLIPVQASNTNSDLQRSSPMTSLSETHAFYTESFSGFSAPPPPFLIQQPQQRYLKEITTDSSTSHRIIQNDIALSTSSNIDEGIVSTKTNQTNDLSTNVRSTTSKPPRISRFSDATPSIPSEPILNTNLSVDTLLNYTQISENINCLPASRRQQKRHNREVMECECTTSEYDRSRGIKACGHECLNRMLLIECSSICPCGQWCTNRRFQRRSYANHKLALFKTEMKGYGLRTISKIRKGRFLVEYIGEVIDMDELVRRNKKYKRDGNIHQYVMSLIHGTVIDSTIKGNWARFINHSCEPNCVAEKWLVNGEYRMGIFAKRELDANEEITIDYRFERFGNEDIANEKCYCGAPTCRGTISLKNNNNNNNNNKNNLNKRQNRRRTIDDDELLDYLYDEETNEYIIPKTIDEIRQLIQIMSRTDSENVRTIELDLIKNGSLKHIELPRLFLECNGLHVLCSWMKDILIIHDNDEQQQYSDQFKLYLLDFIHTVLPIKDRTIVIKNGLLDLVYKKLKLPISQTDSNEMTDQEQIQQLMNSMLNHLNEPIIAKLFHIYSTWMSLKERFIIPKRKESEQNSNYHHHHRHHHHHSSKHPTEENNYRLNFSTRSSTAVQQKPFDRYHVRRSFSGKDSQRTHEQQLSKDERRKLFEQQYEDEEKARAAAATANGESPGGQNEPPHKKQRTSDGSDPLTANTPPQSQNLSTPHQNQIDQTYLVYQHLSQIPIDLIRSYMTSIGQSISIPNTSTGKDKDEPPLPPPSLPENENGSSKIIRLPPGWSVAMCPSDSSVYFYNRETMTTSWAIPTLEPSKESTDAPYDLSPLSSAQIIEQRRPHHHHHEQQQQHSSSSRSALKLSKHLHRHSRSHRHHHQYHHMSSSNKRKRPAEGESTTVVKEQAHRPSIEETSMIIPNEQDKQEEINDKNSVEPTEEMSASVSKTSVDENNDIDMSTTMKEPFEMNDHDQEQTSSNHNNTLTSSFKLNRDLLRKNISQHVHTTLKPYTKRTCKQGRIVSTEDIKYLVKKFTLAVLDKEIEKANNDGIPLSPILTDRVRLKTEVYVKKYMNKMGPVFQRHETSTHAPSSQPSQTTTTTTTEVENPE